MAVVDNDKIAIELDWEPAEGVKGEELKATWARFEMHIGDDVVTQVHDAASASVRRSIYVPLYPLAEWIAFNWWLLRSNSRPSYLSRPYWTFRSRVHRSGHRSSWLKNHNLRAIGDGFAWPDLTIVPSGENYQLAWQGDRQYPPGWQVRFLSSGQAELTHTAVEKALASLVEAVLGRLNDHGIVDTALHQEWRALQDTDSEEAAFCTLAARLGLDPYSLPDPVTELVQRLGDELHGPLLNDFIDAADPTKLDDDLSWVASASDRVRLNDLDTNAVPSLAHESFPLNHPWEVGMKDAKEMRLRMGEGDASEDGDRPNHTGRPRGLGGA